MPVCKFCAQPFAWGNSDGKWVPLVPVGQDENLDRDYQDENGVLRAGHQSICTSRGGPAVRVSKLAKKVPASEILSFPAKPAEEQPTQGVAHGTQ